MAKAENEMLPTSFPLARYRFEWQVTTPLRLPDYAGSTLRGAFGHALRQLACITRQKECAACPLETSCPYPAIFAPLPPKTHALQHFSAIPVPYVVEAPLGGARAYAPGDIFSFHMVLVGRALKELPLIILAWRRALARGIGAGEGTAQLVQVTHCGIEGEVPVHAPDVGTIASHVQRIPMEPAVVGGSAQSRATLHIFTPLRLQQNGHALAPEKLNARALLMALVRRANLQGEFHGDGSLSKNFSPLLAATDNIRDDKNLEWQDWTRYSSRQDQKMTLGGVVGEWSLEGDLAPFLPYLALGQWLHVGKEAAFGLGGYRLSAAP